MAEHARSVRDWLIDVVSWGEQAASYVSDIDEAAFLADRMRQDAVIRCMECVGEASRNILKDPEARTLSHLDLYQAYWARNRFAHGYYDLNMGRVWETVTVSLPKLVADARAALERLPD